MQDQTRSRQTSSAGTASASRRVLLAVVLIGGAMLSGCSGSDSDSDPVVPVGSSTSEPADPAGGQGAGDPAPTETQPGDTTGGTAGTDDAGLTDTGGPAPTEGGDTGAPEAVDPAAMADSARYRLVFDGRWSAETHPQGFPVGPHFSGLVGAVHNEQVRFWEPGQIATDGVKNVAETGGKSPMTDEVQAAIDAGSALTLIDGPGVPESPGTVSIEFEVTRDYPELTLITMLAPSPDWFAGVHNLPLLANGAFVESMNVELSLYDAGTDSGLNYTAADEPTEPRSPILLLTSDPADSPFIDGQPAIGSLSLERLP